MKKIGIVGLGHAFINQYKALKMHDYKIILCDINEEKLKKYNEESYTNYHDLLGKVDAVLVSTPPENHFEIIKYFLENNTFVLSEKPLVTNMEDLNYLYNIANNNNFYNLFHFSFGEEIEYFLRSDFIKYKPIKINAYINDHYIKNEHIKGDKVSMCGAYLDEVINPLSALVRIYGDDIKYLNSNLKTYDGDLYDYYADVHFMLNDIKVNIISSWNDVGNKEKYIDIYFSDNNVIRLDSLNVKVINLKTNEVLFESKKERMLMHYLNAFTDFKYGGGNKEVAFKINKEILKYKAQKIIFIGGIPGSGKTTLAYNLASIYKIDKVINLDVLKSVLKLSTDDDYARTTTHEAYKIESLSYIDGFLKHAFVVNKFYKKIIDNINDNIIIVEGATITKEFVREFKNTNNIYINLTINKEEELINRYKEKLKLRKGDWLNNIDVIKKIDEHLVNQADINLNSDDNLINKVKEVIDESLFL